MKQPYKIRALHEQKAVGGGPFALQKSIEYPVKAFTPSIPPRRFFALPALLLAAGLTACGPSAPPQVKRQAAPPEEETRNTNVPPSLPDNTAGSQRQRQAEFLNRLRAADPQYKTIDKAVLNAQNELGLILDRSVDLDSIPALMRTVLAQMAKEFPGQDLNVSAYAPSNPPMKIGTAHLDARTRDMTYTKEHP